MDASVEQLDGFRFMYVLPLTPTRLLVEDTRYSRSPLIDEDEFDFEIQSYVTQKFLGNYQVVRQEKGCLALPLTMTQYQQPADRGQYNLGLRAGMFQPVTGYSFPYAARWEYYISRKISGLSTRDLSYYSTVCRGRIWQQYNW